MDRRNFLRSLGLVAPALTIPLSKKVGGDPASPDKPPNIIIIMADDMGLGDPGCYNPGSLIPTPHMDRISAEGTRLSTRTPPRRCARRRATASSRGDIHGGPGLRRAS